MGRSLKRKIKKLLFSVRLQVLYLGMEEGRGPAVRMIGCHSCRMTHKAEVFSNMFLGKENPFLKVLSNGAGGGWRVVSIDQL